MAHFYSRHYKNKIWEVGRSLIHSMVLYIGPSKKLNDYYVIGSNTLKTIKVE
jgi:hypothetical protein